MRETKRTWTEERRKAHSVIMKKFHSKRALRGGKSKSTVEMSLKPSHDDLKHWSNDLFVRQVGVASKHFSK